MMAWVIAWLIAAAPPAGEAPAQPCVLHLISVATGEELTRPCAESVRLAAGEYDVWAESGDRIVPHHTRIVARGDTPVSLPHWTWSAAAVVQVTPPADAALVQLVHRSNRFSRSVRPPAGEVLMPAGTIAGWSVNARGDVTAVARPVEAAPRGKATMTLSPPRNSASDLVVFLRRPQPEPAVVTLDDGERQRPPNLLLQWNGVDVGLWYDVAEPDAAIVVRSGTMYLPRTELTLRPGRVHVVRAEARLLPVLTVDVVAPEILFSSTSERWLEVLTSASGRDGETGRPLRRIAVGGAGAYDLGRLPAEEHELVLRCDRWTFRKSVDLSAGIDQSVEFALEPLTISGRVRHGNSPAAAHVAFTSGRDLFETETDELGNYEVILWKPQRYGVRVTLKDGAAAPPYTDTRRLSHSQTLDIDVPDTHFVVRVTDARSGEVIRNAAVTVTNSWPDEAEGRRRMMVTVQAENGEVVLPPLRAGLLAIQARADRYLENEVSRPIPENGRGVIEVRLTAAQSLSAIRLELPGGTPAAGAEVFLVQSERVVFTAAADGEGRIRIPDDLGSGTLVARHAAAGGDVRSWTAGHGPMEWQLPPPAEPLIVEVVDAEGRAVPSARVTLWLRNASLSGLVLGILAGSEAASANGRWMFRRPPAELLRVLARRSSRPNSGEAAQSEQLAASVPYPWPRVVRVPVLH